jgi:hypothetical protein
LIIPFDRVLDSQTCDAWGITFDLPLIMKFAFSSDYFLDSTTVPKVEFHQLAMKGKKPFKLQYQVQGEKKKEEERRRRKKTEEERKNNFNFHRFSRISQQS